MLINTVADDNEGPEAPGDIKYRFVYQVASHTKTNEGWPKISDARKQFLDSVGKRQDPACS